MHLESLFFFLSLIIFSFKLLFSVHFCFIPPSFISASRYIFLNFLLYSALIFTSILSGLFHLPKSPSDDYQSFFPIPTLFLISSFFVLLLHKMFCVFFPQAHILVVSFSMSFCLYYHICCMLQSYQSLHLPDLSGCFFSSQSCFTCFACHIRTLCMNVASFPGR